MKSIKIKGMSCQHCVMAATKALKEIEERYKLHLFDELAKAGNQFTEIEYGRYT